jgi:DNA repair exonuclease SbcCD ATPase subunit|eukprot:CAMPEP_0169133458 /NCGR_PEP_ID=MMETSP1015-20121227/39318_1 /TAXON_ID=342587 /ORGANISM="Karlodinium micrum, Strain CCMP2283" /LENGTH=546 /DNA_ID=CAMNT_0009197841 /DNA_START=55 /DNA_END=1695 /DNA_ORIENTATION=+
MMNFKKKNDEDRKPIEQEIAELQRKFRVLENDKRAYSEDSQGMIRKQRATIEKLTRENRKMKAELNETRSSSSSTVENKIAQEKISKLNDLQEQLEVKMKNALSEADRLDDGHQGTKEGIHQTRKILGDCGGAKAALENAKAVQKQIRILENRLDKGLQKFNEAIEANRALREQIDTLRRERVVFDDIYRKLENELHAKKKEMANIIEQANAAYEARDSAQAQMAALKQQADKEHAEFEKEWRALGELIENDKKMKDHMRKQVRNRVEEGKNDTSKSDDGRSRKKITQNAWDTAKSMVTINSAQTKVTEYEDAFSKIQAATGICDIDELVQKFIDSEDTNFTLFKYNNELSADMEKLEAQIAEHKEEHISLSGTGTRKEDTEKVKILETLEEKWSDIDKKAQLYTEKHQDANQTLKHIQLGIESIFRRIGCVADDLPSGSGHTISEANMITFLGVIEHRTNDLLKLYDQLRGEDEDDVVTETKSRMGQSSANLQIKLPSTVEDYSEDEDDDDEDDQRPFTRDELQIKTKKGISKRQKKSKLKGSQL